MTPMGPFDRLGRFVVRHARLVVAAWAVLIVVALPFAPQAPSALRAGGFIRDDLESARAKALLEQELGSPPSALVVAFHSDRLVAGTPAFETAAASAMRDVPSAPHVVRVISHLLQPRQISADGHTAYDIVFLDLPADDSPDALPILRERLGEAPGLTVELAGGPAFYGDVQHVSERDLQRSEVISLPLAALALLIVFGSLVAAGVPLVVGGSSVLVALAAIFVVAQFTPMSIFVLNLATLLGLGLGVASARSSRNGRPTTTIGSRKLFGSPSRRRVGPSSSAV
jgi:RND superfamily putative drug exporter